MSATRPVISSAIQEWPPFDLAVEPLEGGLVLVVSGELDMATAPALRERLNVAMEAGPTALVVDLRRVTFMDSIGLASILHARSRLGDGGRLAMVLAPESYPQLVLETAGLGRSLALFETREDADAYVAA